MSGGRELLKKIVLVDLVIVIYILLTSTIIDYRSEKKVRDVIVDSVMEWSTRKFDEYHTVMERESRLMGQVDPELTDRLKGDILLQIESKGEAWYVYPIDGKRYFLGKPQDTKRVINELGVSVASEELLNYLYFDKGFPENTAGMIIINKDNENEAYYVHPETRYGHLLGKEGAALEVMRDQGLGITNVNLRKIELGMFEE